MAKKADKSRAALNKSAARVAIVMGSDSDWPVMKEAVSALEHFGVNYKAQIVSAHRTPDLLYEFAKSAMSENYQAIIAGAGGAAHLPGMIAALTVIPVIGVPVATTALQGEDSLLSIVQMPKGVPVATVAISNAYNAGILAVQILAAGGGSQDKQLLEKLTNYKEKLRKDVLTKKLKP